MAKTWRKALSDGVVSGSAAALISTAALAARGERENGTPFGPTNAISHWVWGDKAASHDEPSVRFTLLGYVIHHSASTMWAVLYEKWFGEIADKKKIVPALTSAAAVAALACFVDYKMTPHRLQPGYEMRLSRKSLLVVYAAFGFGLALRGLVSGGK